MRWGGYDLGVSERLSLDLQATFELRINQRGHRWWGDVYFACIYSRAEHSKSEALES